MISFAEPPGAGSIEAGMLRDLNEVIMWGWYNDGRAGQALIGPSELGDPCRRKLAYRIAGLPSVNKAVDPWPALVGTAIHWWVETTIKRFQDTAGGQRWLTEFTVHPDDLVLGRVDLVDLEIEGVWDLKTMGSDKLKEFRELTAQAEQDPDSWSDQLKGYRTQIHLYGLGVTRAGLPIKRVGLIAVPRSGWLSSMVVWSEPYDELIAYAALARLYEIAEQVIELAADERPEQIYAIEATPSRMCSFCNFYTPEPVNGVGCPGK